RTCVTPSSLPNPLPTTIAAGTRLRNALPSCGRIAVTPVCTLPSWIVECPTRTPATSVIALCSPGWKSPTTTPASRARGRASCAFTSVAPMSSTRASATRLIITPLHVLSSVLLFARGGKPCHGDSHVRNRNTHRADRSGRRVGRCCARRGGHRPRAVEGPRRTRHECPRLVPRRSYIGRSECAQSAVHAAHRRREHRALFQQQREKALRAHGREVTLAVAQRTDSPRRHAQQNMRGHPVAQVGPRHELVRQSSHVRLLLTPPASGSPHARRPLRPYRVHPVRRPAHTPRPRRSRAHRHRPASGGERCPP